MSGPQVSASRRDAAIVATLALIARLAVVMWASVRIPPAADGTFYHTIATRIANGQGSTWLWPDGAVTYAAHYPVGYPAILGAAYAIFGSKPAVAMMVNALLGAAGASAVHALACRLGSRKRALAAGIFAALHVGLVAYVPALMTEGLTASLWAIGAWAAMRARESNERRILGWLACSGMILGVATLVRPQTIALVPVFGWLAASGGQGWRVAMQRAIAVTVVALLLCLPWVVRNRVRMGEAGLSFNGGWNLLIGATPSAHGSWAPLEVPETCRQVFDEAKKDACFRGEAVKTIAHEPALWLSIAPAKVAVTFDYCGAAAWYLHDANPRAFPYSWKVALGAAETAAERALLAAALVAVGWVRGPRRRIRQAGAILALLPLFTQHASLSYLALTGLIALFGPALSSAAFVLPAAMAVIALTAVTHVVFFGAGRYGLPVMPFVSALAAGILPWERIPSVLRFTSPVLRCDTPVSQGVDAHAPD